MFSLFNKQVEDIPVGLFERVPTIYHAESNPKL